jgi:hypothetical protein
MGLFDKLFGKKETALPEDRGLPDPKATPEMPKVKKPRKPRVKKEAPTISEKDRATQAGEPYISILKMEIDPNNVNNGSFELDWNSKFVANLARAGYQIKPNEPESDIVDRWFQTVCRNVALEVYEQQQADPTNRDIRNVVTRDIGNGRTEVS